MHAFGWKADDWRRLAAGTLAGHLLECGSQITGGYFADPPYKDVPGLAEIGYPIAEIDPDGAIVIGKPSGTGGRIDRQTVIEQMLYEIHDPAGYLVPDVVLDLTDVEVEEIGADRVRVTGARGKPAPRDAESHRLHRRGNVRRSRDFLCRAECRRARAARRRDHRRTDESARTRIGVPHRCHRRHQHPWRFRRRVQKTMDCRTPADIRLRFAAQSANAAEVELLLDEVEALYCAGPAGGAGVRRRMTPRLASASCLIERKYASPRVTMLGAGA